MAKPSYKHRNQRAENDYFSVDSFASIDEHHANGIHLIIVAVQNQRRHSELFYAAPRSRVLRDNGEIDAGSMWNRFTAITVRTTNRTSKSSWAIPNGGSF